MQATVKCPRQQKAQHRGLHPGLGEVSHRCTGACRPAHARWIQPMQSARNDGRACEMGQHAAICTKQGVGHITQGLCEISPSALLSAAPCVHCDAATLCREPPLWRQLSFALERGAGSRNNARQRPAWHSNLSVVISEIRRRPSRQSVVAYSRPVASSTLLLPRFANHIALINIVLNNIMHWDTCVCKKDKLYLLNSSDCPGPLWGIFVFVVFCQHIATMPSTPGTHKVVCFFWGGVFCHHIASAPSTSRTHKSGVR